MQANRKDLKKKYKKGLAVRISRKKYLMLTGQTESDVARVERPVVPATVEEETKSPGNGQRLGN